MRRHYFLNEYCIIAAERSKRPSDFKKKEAEEKGDPKNCPFCIGNEDKTPPATAVYTDEGILADGADERVRNWHARCFPNLFPAMAPDPQPPIRDWVALGARGFHEVIVESPRHQASPADFDSEEMERMISVYEDRYSHYISSEGVEYVSIFKNWGRVAGASLSHTHTQLIAMPLVPPLLMREMEAISSQPTCPYCSLAEREALSDRFILEKGGWVLIAPFYSQVPYETWILPKEHLSSLGDLDERQKRDLAHVLGEALRRMSHLLDDPPYNYMIYQHSDRRYHLNLRIQPVTSKMAGFEKNTGIFINTVSPEQAAADVCGIGGR
jgi:UDPglucose--hexose-1-phosphate uridylyltransferase